MVKMISALALSLSLMMNPTSIGSSTNPAGFKIPFEVCLVIPDPPEMPKRAPVKTGEFLGYKLAQPCDTNVSGLLQNALREYSGPEVEITSLRRHGKGGSKHNSGNAVDYKWSPVLIDWLVSEEGTAWCEKFNLMFYIEGKPGSKQVKEYLDKPGYAEHVFFNPHATGDHVHLNVRI